MWKYILLSLIAAATVVGVFVTFVLWMVEEKQTLVKLTTPYKTNLTWCIKSHNVHIDDQPD